MAHPDHVRARIHALEERLARFGECLLVAERFAHALRDAVAALREVRLERFAVASELRLEIVLVPPAGRMAPPRVTQVTPGRVRYDPRP